MTFPNPRRGAVARASVALAAAAFGAGLLASPVHAEEAPYPISASAYPSDSQYFYVGWSEETQRQRAHFYIDLGDSDHLVEGEDVHVVLGLADDLGGLTFETEHPGCFADGAVITCDFTDVETYAIDPVEFSVLVPPNVNAHADTEYTISVEPGDYDASRFVGTWQFVPVDEEIEWSYETSVDSFEGVEPGTSVSPDIAFYNSGEATFQDVYLSFWADQWYLDIVADYRNCGVNDYGEVMCVLEDLAPAPGEVYELAADTPLTVTLDEMAPGPMAYHTSFHIHPVDFWGQHYIDQIDFPDSGAELRFERSEREPFEESSQLEVVSAANPYDVAVDDRNLEAEVGDATLAIEIRNDGPADALSRSHPGSGEGRFTVTIQLPSGVELDGVDEYGYIETNGYYCTIGEVEWIAGLDPADYLVERIDVQCGGPDTLPAGESVTLDLPVTVTDATASADGLVSVQEAATTWADEDLAYWDLTTEDFPVIDGDLGNNVAAIGLNSSDLADGGESPKLPTTGVPLTVVFGTAAAVLVAGAVLSALLRRRKAAEW